MAGKQNLSFMQRCGLTFERLAAAHTMELGEPEDGLPFSIRMRNDVKLSSSDRPSVATAVGRVELVRVELHDDLLTIADIRGERRDLGDKVAECIGARLYARRTIALEGVTTFMFLSQPPPGRDRSQQRPVHQLDLRRHRVVSSSGREPGSIDVCVAPLRRQGWKAWRSTCFQSTSAAMSPLPGRRTRPASMCKGSRKICSCIIR
jgi:hypothetical protein